MTEPMAWSAPEAIRLQERARRLTGVVLRGRASAEEQGEVAAVVTLELLSRPPSDFANRYIANLIHWRFRDMCRQRDPEAARRSRDADGPFWVSSGNLPIVNDAGEETLPDSPGQLLQFEQAELERIAGEEIAALEAAALARCRDADTRGSLRRALDELGSLVRGEQTIEALVSVAAPEQRSTLAATLYKRHERARQALVNALGDVTDRTLSAFLGITTHDLLLAHIERLRRQRRRRATSGGGDG